MIHLARERHAHRRRNHLVQQAANLALAVDLGAEDAAGELVLGALTSWRAHQWQPSPQLRPPDDYKSYK